MFTLQGLNKIGEGIALSGTTLCLYTAGGSEVNRPWYKRIAVSAEDETGSSKNTMYIGRSGDTSTQSVVVYNTNNVYYEPETEDVTTVIHSVKLMRGNTEILSNELQQDVTITQWHRMVIRKTTPTGSGGLHVSVQFTEVSN